MCIQLTELNDRLHRLPPGAGPQQRCQRGQRGQDRHREPGRETVGIPPALQDRPVVEQRTLEAALTDAVGRVDRTGRTIRIVCPHPLPTMPEGVLAAAYFFALEAMTKVTGTMLRMARRLLVYKLLTM